MRAAIIRTPLFLFPVLLLGLAGAAPYKAPKTLHRQAPQAAPPIDAQARAFFEQKVRPLLVEQCYSCHSAQSKPLMGSLRLDSRAGLLKGGIQGAALIPGRPEQSLLIKAIHYTDNALKMPPKGKLTDAQIAILIEWVKMGAPDPREEKPGKAPVLSPTSAAARANINIEEGRKHWAFQPLRRTVPPTIQNPKSKIPSMLSFRRNSLRRALRRTLPPIAEP